MSLTYGGYGEVASMAGPFGAWSFAQDAAGRESASDYGGGFLHTVEYDAFGRETAATNPLAGRVGRRFDDAGRLEAWELPDGTEMQYQRDAAGRMTRLIDPMGRASDYTYDAAGRIASLSTAAAGPRTYQRDGVGRVRKVTDALGQETSFGYHPDGRLAWNRDPLGRQWSFSYSPGGFDTVDPLQRTTRTETGSENEVTKVIYPDGSQESVEYLDGTPQGERDAYPTRWSLPGGAQRTFTYDSLGRLAGATDLSGAEWSYSVQTDGLKETLSTPAGDLVREDVLSVDLDLLSRRFGDGGLYSFSYGLGTEPMRITKPSGETIDFTYDAAGRASTRVTSGGEGEAFDRDAIGDPHSFSDPSGTSTWSYDPGRPSALVHSDGSSVAWSWDVLGRLTGVTVTSGSEAAPHATWYRYDAPGDLVEVETPELGVATFEYDALHRLIRRTLPNGVVSEWSYDLRDRVVSVQHAAADGSVLASYVYTRGLLGELERVDREDGRAVEWTYDDALRVTAERRYDASGTLASETTWTWDSAGNRLTATSAGTVAIASYLSGQRLQAVTVDDTATESYAWDPDGRLASMSRDGTTWTLGHDSKEALRSISDGTTTIDYVHDALGRRRSASDGTRTRTFVAGPVAPGGLDVAHHVSDGVDASQLVWAGTQPLARVDADGTVRWYLEDGLGSVVGLADEAGGLAASREYDAFGNVAATAGEAGPAHLGGGLAFHGEWRESATGLYHLRARDYDPRTGRFLSRDPAEGDLYQPESLHPYLFAFGNPLLYQDPTGLYTVTEVNVATTARTTVTPVQGFSLHQIRREIAEDIQEAMVGLLVEAMLAWIGPGLSNFVPISGSTLSKIGSQFEHTTQDLLCQVVPSEALHFEVGIWERTGVAADDGYGGCPPERRNFGGVKRKRRPDILVNQGSPMAGHKSLLIAEVKLGIGTFYNAWKKKRRGQWDAISKHSNRSYPPKAVLLIALKGYKWPYKKRWLRKILRRGRHYGIILQIL